MASTQKPQTVRDRLEDLPKDRETFLRTNPDPVIIVVGYEHTGEEARSARTNRLGDWSSGQIRSMSAAYVIPVHKERSLGADKILVGRGRENDVVLPFKSVSRLHAFFRLGPGEVWMLEDAGSAYGTFVRDVRLTSGHVRAVGDDTPIRFGGVEAIFRTPEGLHDFLTKFSKMRD